MFVRAKTIKGQKYAYLVENKWRRGRAKQKVKKYLGKIVDVSYHDVGTVDFSGKTSKELIRHILINFLLSCGFVQKTRNKLRYENVIIDIGRFKITEQDKDVVLHVDTGYLYGKTLRELFKLQHDPIALRPGVNIAEAFTKAGIKIYPQDFILLYTLLEKEYEGD